MPKQPPTHAAILRTRRYLFLRVSADHRLAHCCLGARHARHNVYGIGKGLAKYFKETIRVDQTMCVYKGAPKCERWYSARLDKGSIVQYDNAFRQSWRTSLQQPFSAARRCRLSGLVPHAFLALCPHEGISNLQRGSIAINGNCGCCQIHFLESHHTKKGPLVGGPSPFGGSFSRQEPPMGRREVGSISIRATGTQVAIGL